MLITVETILADLFKEGHNSFFKQVTALSSIKVTQKSPTALSSHLSERCDKNGRLFNSLTAIGD